MEKELEEYKAKLKARNQALRHLVEAMKKVIKANKVPRRTGLPFLLLWMSVLFYAGNVAGQNMARVFDGTDDHITATAPTFLTYDDFTVEAWVRTDDLSAAQCVYEIINSTSNFVQLNITADDKLQAVVTYSSGGSQYRSRLSEFAIIEGLWYHVAITWDVSSHHVYLYINGTMQVTSESSASMPSGNMSNTTYLGGRSDGSLDFTGALDEFRIWGDIRTVVEQRWYMNTELPTPANTLVDYEMNETSGSTVDNAQGSSGYDGTASGTTIEVSAAFYGPKYCLDFDGVDDYVNAYNPDFPTTELSIEVWVYLDDGATNDWARFVYRSRNSVGSPPNLDLEKCYYSLCLDNAMHPRFAIGRNGGDGYAKITALNDPLSTDRWYHIAGTYSKSDGQMKLYINGELVKTVTYAEDIYNYLGVNYGDFVGASGCGTYTDYYLDGKLDEVRVWNKCLTQDQIIAGMNQTLNGSESNLSYYLRFDDAGSDYASYGNYPTVQSAGMYNMDASDYQVSTAFNTWLSTNSSSWSTATNWSAGTEAGADDNVGLYDDFATDPVIPTGTTVNTLVVGDWMNVEIGAGNNLTVTENMYTDDNTDFTIRSTGLGTSGTGSLIVGGDASGDITFERYADIISKGDKWHYVSAPVSNQRIDDTWMSNSGIQSTPAYQFFRFDEPEDYWIIFGSTGDPVAFGDYYFADARGYCLSRATNGILTFTGGIIAEDVGYAASCTSGKGNGFNLVGNPFTSAIGVTAVATSVENFLTVNASLIDDNYEALYIWDEQSGYTFGRNDYKVISNAAITGYTSIDQDYIAPGQAFMLKVVDGGGTLNFNRDMQYHSNAAAYKSKELWPSVELTVVGNGSINHTAIGFHPEMTDGLDPSYDVAKFKGNPDLALYTRLLDDNGYDFAVQALNSDHYEGYVVPVGVDLSEEALMEFSLTQHSLSGEVFLQDKLLNTSVNLSKENYITLVRNSGTGRFYLHFAPVGTDETETRYPVQVFSTDESIVIINPQSRTGEVRVTNLLGQTVLSTMLHGAEKQTLNIHSAHGVYMVQVDDGDHIIARQKVWL